MSGNSDTDGTTPTPDEAFAVLGNETRMRILRTLGEAEGPLSFSELRESVGVSDSGQFNYHLGEVTDHFVHKTAEGYDLARPGRRVIEAILSGALTDDPALERSRVGESCAYCGAPVEIDWRAGSVGLHCTGCEGRYGSRRSTSAQEGYLGRLPLPPAGVRGRTLEEVLWAARAWGNLEMLSMAAGICPRCSATVEHSFEVCGDHDADEGLCETCDSRYAAGLHVECTNCVFEGGGAGALAVLADTHLLSFLVDHGLNPVSMGPDGRLEAVYADYEEAVLSADPFRGRFTFRIDGDALTLTVEGTTVTDATRE